MPPLKLIPRNLPADLLHVLASMGHGDELVIVDTNFPAASVANTNNNKFIDMSGQLLIPIVQSICQLLPLDQYVDSPCAVMDRVASDAAKNMPTPIWDEFQAVVDKAEGKHVSMERVERMAFYERAKKAYAVISTGDGAQYACFILKKGIIPF